MAGRLHDALVLTQAGWEILHGWTRRRTTAQGLALRARMVLACADESHTRTAERLGVDRKTVGRWHVRFARDRLDGLSDEPRPGVPRTVTDAQVEDVVVRTLETTAEGDTHWSKRKLATVVGLSPSTVGRIWRAFGLKPWLVQDFKVSPDPLFIDKVRDVVGLYLDPPQNAPVFWWTRNRRSRRWNGPPRCCCARQVLSFMGLGVPPGYHQEGDVELRDRLVGQRGDEQWSADREGERKRT